MNMIRVNDRLPAEMDMSVDELIKYIADQKPYYDEMPEKGNTDFVSWMAAKLTCTRTVAQVWIRKAGVGRA